MTIRVLLADDHALMREGLRALLGATPDIEVIGEVGTGREAEKQVGPLSPDVVLMDVAMPDLNGIEAARAIHLKCPAIRIVMLSMHATAEHVYRAFEAGASGYLLKELAVDEVITAVRTVHGGGRYLSSALAESVPDPTASGHTKSPVDSLSARERQVLQLVAEGRTSIEIARMIHLSQSSVQTYRSRLMMKLGVSDVPSLVKFALEHGLTTPPV
jgi:DNA-binding NarL/FixJ family response regulator